MSYADWIGAQWILKKTNAAGILGLFRYPRPQTGDESPSKNAAVKEKKSPIASDYYRSQKKHTVLRLCLSKASTWIHYPLQTSDTELITACTQTVCSSQGIFSFWPQSTLWQVAEYQHLPAGETEAWRGSYFCSASLTCRSTGERRRETRNPDNHSNVLRALNSAPNLALQLHRKAVPYARSHCALKPFSVAEKLLFGVPTNISALNWLKWGNPAEAEGQQETWGKPRRTWCTLWNRRNEILRNWTFKIYSPLERIMSDTLTQRGCFESPIIQNIKNSVATFRAYMAFPLMWDW